MRIITLASAHGSRRAAHGKNPIDHRFPINRNFEGGLLGIFGRMNWSLPTLLFDFRTQWDQPTTYVAPVGMGDDPRTLGKQVYIFYTRYPTTGAGWNGASVNRLTVSCP